MEIIVCQVRSIRGEYPCHKIAVYRHWSDYDKDWVYFCKKHSDERFIRFSWKREPIKNPILPEIGKRRNVIMTKSKTEEELMREWLEPFGKKFQYKPPTKEELELHKEVTKYGNPFKVSEKERDRLWRKGTIV